MSEREANSAAGGKPRWPLYVRLYVAALRRLRLWLGISVFELFRRELSPGLEIPQELLERYRFCELGAAELEAHAADPALELPPAKVRAAARRGDVFFGVFDGDTLVAYRWYALSGAAPCEDGMQFLFAHAARAYGYRTFTRHAYRGRRLHLYSTRDSDTRLAARGITHAVGYIAAHNIASLKANARLPGVTRIGTIVTFRVGRRMRRLRTPGAVRNGIDMAEAAP